MMDLTWPSKPPTPCSVPAHSWRPYTSAAGLSSPRWVLAFCRGFEGFSSVNRLPARADRGLTRMVYNTGGMTLFGSWRFSVGASLAAAVLLCAAAFLSWTVSELPAIQTTADSPRIEHGANGHPLTGSYLATPAEEAGEGARDPVNADLLTALLLAFSFGMSVGWVLANGRGQEAFCSSGVARRSTFAVGEDLPFLGVFRL
jgi:hypothetical protein